MQPSQFMEFVYGYLANQIDYAGNTKIHTIVHPNKMTKYTADRVMAPAFLNRVMRLKGPHTSLDNFYDNVCYHAESKNGFVYITVRNKKDFRVGMVEHVETLLRTLESVHDGILVESIKHETDYIKDRYGRNWTYLGMKKKSVELKIRVQEVSKQPTFQTLSIKQVEAIYKDKDIVLPEPPAPKPITFDDAYKILETEERRLYQVYKGMTDRMKELETQSKDAYRAWLSFRNKYAKLGE